MTSCTAAAVAMAPSAQRLTDLFDAAVPGALNVSAPPARVAGSLFFPGWDAGNEWAVWASDGSSPRATLLRSSRAETPVAFGGAAFFVGTDPTSARLWRSDGSPEGTRPVAELGGPLAGSLTAAGGALYLRGGDGHPWRSDGTAAGTLRLSEDAALTDVPGFTDWNGAVYFLATGGDGDLGLWSTAGTPATTRRVADLGSAAEASRFAYGLSSYAGRLYFYTSEEAFGARYRLWSYDGSGGGAAALHDFPGTSGPICPGPCFGIGPDTLAGLGGRLIFFADDGVHGRELWRTDGTAGGTELLADINPGGERSIWSPFMDPRSSGHTPSYAVFAADDGVHGVEPWITDGTAPGTHLLADLTPGSDGSSAYGFVAVDERIYFSANDAIRSTDGTAGGTTVFRAGGALLYPVAGGFAAVDANGVWSSDGSSLTLVDDLARPSGLDPLGMVAFGSGVAFSRLDDDNTLRDLWLFGGGRAGVLHHFASIWTLPSAAGGALWLGADDGVHGVEPWISDGTTAGTRLLRDIASGGDSTPQLFTAAASRVFFTAADGTHGVELWETDGTESGTSLVRDFQPGEFGSVPGYLTPFRGALAFSIFYPQGGLWGTDGTDAGSREIAPLSASFLAQAGEILFFVGYQDATGYELWKSDGTRTALVKDAVPGPANANSYALTPAGARIFYISQVAADQELWTSNGTEAGTLRLASFRLINELTAVGDALFFEADDGAHGLELWASDGTPAGTRLVRDIAPGRASSSPSSLAAAGDLLLFAADDGEHGIEPWVSDGTEEGTRLLEDLAEGPTSSHPEQFRPAGALVYFRARDEEAGAQLWSIRADALSAPPRERPRATRIVPLREPIP